MTTEQENKNVAEVIIVLNMARRMELTSIHQYMIHHYELDDMNFGALASEMRKTSIQEMRHAEWLAERIKELGGTPVSDLDDSIKTGLSIQEVFAYDRQLESKALERYNEFIHICNKCNDSISKRLFERILTEEQEHWNGFDDIDTHIANLGNTYLARMAGGDAD